MTSIFYTSFESILERINSKSHDTRELTNDNIGRKRTFADVLTGAQKHNGTESLSKNDEPKTSVRASISKDESGLSNLTLSEKGISNRIDAIIAPSRVLKDESIPARLLSKTSLSVKSNGYSVKSSSPPAPQLVELSLQPPETPARPELLDVRRVQQEPEKSKELFSKLKEFFSRKDLENIIKTSGVYHGVDPSLSLAVAQAESSFDVYAVSKDGHETKGLFQLLDTTAQDMLSDLKVDERYDPYDPALSAYLGVGYLKQLHDIFSKETVLVRGLITYPAISAGDLEKLAVAAYNTGQGNVARAQEKAYAANKNPGEFVSIESFLPLQTQQYVEKVMGFKRDV